MIWGRGKAIGEILLAKESHMNYTIKGGKKDGLFKCFSRNDLFVLGEYTADNISGTWYMFGDEGELRCTIDSIELNKDSIYTGYCRIFYKYKCYRIDYYPSGAVKSEGYMVC